MTTTTKLSPRAEVAHRIADFICEHRMTNPFGGDVEKDGRRYEVLFSRPRTLDGLVHVYGPNFILVDSRGPGGDGKHVFESEANALAYLNARFVNFDREAANSIPRKGSR